MNIFKRIRAALGFQIDVTRLTLEPGDIVLLTTKTRLTPDIIEHVKETWRKRKLDNEVIVLDCDFTIKILHRPIGNLLP